MDIEQRRRAIVVPAIHPQPVTRAFGEVHLEVAAQLAGARDHVGRDAFGAQRFEHCVGKPRVKIRERNVMASDEPVVATWHDVNPA